MDADAGLCKREAEACVRTEASFRDGCKTKNENVYSSSLVSFSGACYVADEVRGPQWQVGHGPLGGPLPEKVRAHRASTHTSSPHAVPARLTVPHCSSAVADR